MDAGVAAAQIIVHVRAMVEAEEDLATFLAELPQSQPGLRVETKGLAKANAVPFSEDSAPDTKG